MTRPPEREGLGAGNAEAQELSRIDALANTGIPPRPQLTRTRGGGT
jgi:hypothetical protein